MASNPGYLIPSLRCTRNIWRVSIRNLLLESQASCWFSSTLFFTLSAAGAGADSRVLYVSEDVPAVVTPNWMPIEWSPDSRRGAAAAASALGSAEVLLRVFSRSAAATSSASSHARYFPSESSVDGTVGGAGVAPIWSVRVDLGALVFLGFDLLASLPAAVAATTGKRARSGDDGKTVLLPHEAAGLALDALPANALVVELEDGCYVTAELAHFLRRGARDADGGVGGGGAAAAAGSSPTPLAPLGAQGVGGILPHSSFEDRPPLGSPVARAPAQKHNLRGAFDGIHRLLQLERDTAAAEAAAASALADAAAAFERSAHSLAAAAPTLRAAERSVEAAAAVAAATAAADAEEAALAVESHALAAEGGALRRACAELGEIAALLPAMSSELESARGNAVLLRSLVSAKQLALLGELRAVYPVAESLGRWSVRGIALPAPDSIFGAPEEQVSTALGYTAHLVALSAKYLGVPLRFTVHHMASRSTMRDDVLPWSATVGGEGAATAAAVEQAGGAPSAFGREWPLFWRSGDKEPVRVAMRMLLWDIAQLLASQGLSVADNEHPLASLNKLTNALLTAPLK